MGMRRWLRKLAKRWPLAVAAVAILVFGALSLAAASLRPGEPRDGSMGSIAGSQGPQKALLATLAAGQRGGVLSAPPASPGGVEYYLKIDGIRGESLRDRFHRDWIDISSFGWGASRPSGGSGKVQMQDFSFVSQVSQASPKLFLAVAKGEHIRRATLDVVRTEQEEAYLVIKFEDVIVTSYRVSGNDALAVEEVTLDFAKISIDYRPTDPRSGELGAPVHASWDIKANKSY